MDDRSYMRDARYRGAWPVSVILILVNVAFFALALIAQLVPKSSLSALLGVMALYPTDLLHGWIWQLLTFQVLHAGPLHLLLNCAMLYMFGRPVEDTLGRGAFLQLYVAGGAVGGLLQALFGLLFPAHFGLGPVVGASAGVFTLIAAFAVMNRDLPITTLLAFIIPVTMRARYLLVVEAVIAVLGMLDRQSGIAHTAHLGGMIAGMVYILYIRPRSWPSWTVLRTLRRSRPIATPVPRELVRAPVGRVAAAPQRAAARPEPMPSGDFISAEVDPILDKISAHGIHSLTERERRILELARARMNK